MKRIAIVIAALMVASCHPAYAGDQWVNVNQATRRDKETSCYCGDAIRHSVDTPRLSGNGLVWFARDWVRFELGFAPTHPLDAGVNP